jgi:hypothetical protein
MESDATDKLPDGDYDLLENGEGIDSGETPDGFYIVSLVAKFRSRLVQKINVDRTNNLHRAFHGPTIQIWSEKAAMAKVTTQQILDL